MIEIQQLSKTYNGGITALREINMTIEPGMFGLIGPNGAGKTTLIRILAGLLSPSEGRVSIFGYDLTTHEGKQSAKALLGYLPQDLGLYPTLTGREFLDYIAILKGVTGSAIRKKQVEELLEVVRLTDSADRRIKSYSGGMKRRIGIAQALIGEPRLLIVDEPTVGLDPEERVRFRNLLSTMASRCTVILSTHIIEDISHSCTDLAVMNKGGVLFRSAPRDLIAAARGHVWIAATDGEAPSGDLTVVSTLQTSEGVRYRVVGEPGSEVTAEPVDPTLEDSYIWMMKSLN